MKLLARVSALSIISVGLIGFLLPSVAQQTATADFSAEIVGAEPKSFVSVVGVWRIEKEGEKTVLSVDGRQWKEGQSASGIADKARALYGERYAEFLDRVQAYAYYPYAVFKDLPEFKDGEISVRFEGLSGRIDQGAGILFNLKPNGDYLAIRANCLEDNLVLWNHFHPCEGGHRSARCSNRHAGRMTFVDFHLVVPSAMSAAGAHEICDRIERTIKKEVAARRS
jgi:hypothetical protein